MKKIIFLLVMTILTAQYAFAAEEYRLPKPKHEGKISVEEAIFERRSVRDFKNKALSLEEVSQVLWSAAGTTVDGITGPTRAFPSAGAVYPLEVYLVAGDVNGLPSGVYLYDWRRNVLKKVKSGDMRDELSKAALGQKMVKDAPVTLLVTALYEKIARKYGQRGVIRYISMDAGHMGQNVHLQAESMGLGTVMVGAFIDSQVQKVVGTEGEEKPIYLMPIGYEKQ